MDSFDKERFLGLSEAQQLEQLAACREQLKDMVVVKIDDLEVILKAIAWVSHEVTRHAYNRLMAALAAAKARRAAGEVSPYKEVLQAHEQEDADHG